MVVIVASSRRAGAASLARWSVDRAGGCASPLAGWGPTAPTHPRRCDACQRRTWHVRDQTTTRQGGPMTQMDVGPIDYLAVELPGAKLQGRGLAALVDLTDRGIIRILDLVVVQVDENGTSPRGAHRPRRGRRAGPRGVRGRPIGAARRRGRRPERRARRPRQRGRPAGLREHLGRPVRQRDAGTPVPRSSPVAGSRPRTSSPRSTHSKQAKPERGVSHGTDRRNGPDGRRRGDRDRGLEPRVAPAGGTLAAAVGRPGLPGAAVRRSRSTPRRRPRRRHPWRHPPPPRRTT